MVEGTIDRYNYEGGQISSEELANIFTDWAKKYPISSIEDGMAEDDWPGWMNLIEKIGDKVLLIGDDNLVTQGARLMKLIGLLKEKGFIDPVTGKVTKKIGILIKLNQNGFLTTGINDPSEGYLGTVEVIRLAKKYGIELVISHRSKEAEAGEKEVSIAHIAAFANAYGLKSGDHVQATRAVKEDELAAIEAKEINREASLKPVSTLNFTATGDVLNALKGIVDLQNNGKVANIADEKALRATLIDKLVYDATFNEDKAVKSLCQDLIAIIAERLGAVRGSVYDIYVEKANDKSHWTVPAINIRFAGYDTARAIMKSAIKNNAKPVIFEIAKSEIKYTDQRPKEFATSVLAAAIKEGYYQPIYLQGDHFQIDAKKYFGDAKKGIAADPEGAINDIKALIKDGIEAGFYQIDLDDSVLVDWSKATADEQQRDNYTETALLTAYVRSIEPKGVTVNLGGEIGEIGKGLEKGKERNSSVEDLVAFMEGYRKVLASLGTNLKPITKIAVQTGTKHGGIRNEKGEVVKAKVSFNALAELGEAARERYGLAGAVQHGASTLDSKCFVVFAGNEAPEGFDIPVDLLSDQNKETIGENPVAEVHLATAYQDTTLDHPLFPKELKAEIDKYVFDLPATQEGINKKGLEVEGALKENRKNAAGPFKRALWDMPAENKAAVMESLEKQFDAVFINMGVAKTNAGNELTLMTTEEDAMEDLERKQMVLGQLSGAQSVIPETIATPAVSTASLVAKPELALDRIPSRKDMAGFDGREKSQNPIISTDRVREDVSRPVMMVYVPESIMEDYRGKYDRQKEKLIDLAIEGINNSGTIAETVKLGLYNSSGDEIADMKLVETLTKAKGASIGIPIRSGISLEDLLKELKSGLLSNISSDISTVTDSINIENVKKMTDEELLATMQNIVASFKKIASKGLAELSIYNMIMTRTSSQTRSYVPREVLLKAVQKKGALSMRADTAGEMKLLAEEHRQKMNLARSLNSKALPVKLEIRLTVDEKSVINKDNLKDILERMGINDVLSPEDVTLVDSSAGDTAVRDAYDSLIGKGYRPEDIAIIDRARENRQDVPEGAILSSMRKC